MTARMPAEAIEDVLEIVRDGMVAAGGDAKPITTLAGLADCIAVQLWANMHDPSDMDGAAFVLGTLVGRSLEGIKMMNRQVEKSASAPKAHH